MVASKPEEHRPAWYTFVSNQFRHPDIGGGLRKRDVAAIEHLLRRGHKMVEHEDLSGSVRASTEMPTLDKELRQDSTEYSHTVASGVKLSRLGRPSFSPAPGCVYDSSRAPTGWSYRRRAHALTRGPPPPELQ
ncbi:hypothetical protein C6P46_003592 [Rhodotorula mucilaginosa]|uniref:Uncharacterized protein n=1 Tax=Rhodotorula mucilaginosa TaxID=5537 RepID=A0A9P7BA97_RHOMI|nr:hypothetical protein C6P46_003592 [Rhodotorula mucilaginosa]